MATVSISGAVVTISGVAKGTATLTITAADPDGQEATQTISVTVPNRPPEPTGTISARDLSAGETVTVSVASYFSDPDGDALSYTATSSDTNAATASASGVAVTITGVARGIATVTVKARDPDGLEATQQISVSVQRTNQPPASANSIPSQVLGVSETVTVDLATYFNDPDGDPLDYTASTSDGNVATASTSASAVTVSGVAQGTATVTVTARDPGGLEATQEFGVTVQSNRAPETVGQIVPPRSTMDEGDAIQVNVSSNFSDPDGDSLTYSATTSDQNTLSVSVGGSDVTVTGVGPGTATVTVVARDPGDLEATQTFSMTVERVERRPEATGEMFAQALARGQTVTLDMSSYFNDPDGGELEFSATTSNSGVATASVSGSEVTISGVRSGTATITVTARDPDQLEARQSSAVAVLNVSGQFNLELDFRSPLSESNAEVFRNAAERWMSILADSEFPDMTVPESGEICLFGVCIPIGSNCPAGASGDSVDELIIGASVVEIDGRGKILGRAGPCAFRESLIPFQGFMEFDVDDLAALEEDGVLEAVILHEMGHVLGVGSTWGDLGLLQNPSLGTDEEVDTHFSGSLTIEAFDNAGGADYGGEKVPVENCANRHRGAETCGDRRGSDDGHWRESVLDTELMTPFLGSGASPLSAITIQSLADMGYTVDVSEAEAYQLPDSAAAARDRGRKIFLGNDIIRTPIVVVGENGRVTRVIPR